MFNNKQFVNPYNFISLEQSKTKWVNFVNNESEYKTGYINISLTVKNSIVIPGKKDEKTNISDYYHYPESDDPVIPGSQLRGVVRGVYEALTNSCLSSINADEDYILSRRTSMYDAKYFKPYVLHYENEKWYLMPATKYKYNPDHYDFSISNDGLYIKGRLLKAFSHVEPIEADDNYFDCLDIRENPNSRKILHTSNTDTHGDRDAWVFVPRFNNVTTLTERDINNFKKCIKLFNTNAVDFKSEENYKRYDEALKNKQDMTVYANIIGNKVYISPSQIGRKMAYNLLSDCYKGYEPCDSLESCCPACSLFGFTNSQSGNASTGKVKFLDLYKTPESQYSINTKDFVSLNPKVANFNFYSTRKDWDENGVRIRGRKFYWHNSKLITPKGLDNDNTKSSYKVINKTNNGDLVFTGKVYFNKITVKELKYLIFALCLGNDNIHMHKIGHAKPFGYGSVSIKCDSLYFRAINKDTNDFGIISTKQDLNDYLLKWNQLEDKRYIHELEKITNVETTKDLDVQYPYLEEGKHNPDKDKGFSWFVEHPDLALPYITNSDIGLTTEGKFKKNNNNYKGGNYRNNNGYKNGYNNKKY